MSTIGPLFSNQRKRVTIHHSPTAGYLTLIGGLGSAAYLDLIENAYPTWFKGLRILLTTVAVVSLVTGLACQFTLEEKRGTNRLSNLESK